MLVFAMGAIAAPLALPRGVFHGFIARRARGLGVNLAKISQLQAVGLASSGSALGCGQTPSPHKKRGSNAPSFNQRCPFQIV